MEPGADPYPFKSDTERAEFLSRRGMFGGVAALSAMAAMSKPAMAQNSIGQLVDPNGDYEKAPLKKDTITYALIQSPVWPLDPDDAEAGKRKNVQYMAQLYDEMVNDRGVADLVSFHELPLGGFFKWTREEMLRVAVDIPGPETEVIGAKCKEFGMWATFGCYGRDPDWPGHVLMLGVLMNPQGEVASVQWKARSSHLGGGMELLTTTVYDTLPRFVEMYGWDAVIPVARTEVGNICISGVQYEPTLYTAMAMKGCEICVRQASRSNPEDDALVTSRYHRFYSGLVTNSISPGHRYFADFAGAWGITQIIGTDGKPMAKVHGSFEEIIRADLPLGPYRETHRIPDIQWALYQPLFDQYRPRFESGTYLQELPPTMDAGRARYSEIDGWAK